MHTIDHKAQAQEYIDQNSTVFTDLSDRIWETPELSLKEFRSAEMYIQILREHGFDVTEELGGIKTAFCGRAGHGRPVIGFLGEFDALSGMSQEKASTEEKPVVPGGPGHGCGHNMLGAGSLAAAFAVKNYLEKNGREGTVIFYGCPGEEGGAGKAFLARDGYWRDLDAALTWHPSDVNEIVTGTNNSSIQVLYEFHGRAAHAAGDPENGRSALDAVELMNTGVQYLREHMSSDCRVHYAILNGGGVSPNVVQAYASVLYMVRANKVRDSVKLLERVDKIAQGAALMTETRFDRTFIDGTAELVPNYALEEVLYSNFSKIGVSSYTEEELIFASRLKDHCPVEEVPGLGTKFSQEAADWVREKSAGGTLPLNSFLIPLVHSNGFTAGSTDVGDVSWQTPAAQIHVSAFISGAPGHSWQNVSCGGSTIGHKALLLAGKVLSCSAIDLYEDPSLLEDARAEFARRTAEGYTCPIEKDAVPIAI
ncbi:MAG: amidohydrolase [Lachnospiraceae bacterium]|nr:amidohydrolase [Lachnospiraceae bacterium]